jgi:predicted dehydrogenase
VPLTLQAAAAGKHVLCEKPTYERDLRRRPRRRKVLTPRRSWCAYHPQWRARDLLRRGIGTLWRWMFFGYTNVDPANVRNRPDTGGGGLYDIGCYAIVAGRFFLASEPVRAIALVDRDPAFGTDRLTSALVDFGDGRRLDFTVSTQIAPHQRLQLLGSKGRIELAIPINAPQGATTRIAVDDCTSPRRGRHRSSRHSPRPTSTRLQGEAFSRAVRGEIELPWGVEDAIANMRVIDAVPFRAERSLGVGRPGLTRHSCRISCAISADPPATGQFPPMKVWKRRRRWRCSPRWRSKAASRFFVYWSSTVRTS